MDDSNKRAKTAARLRRMTEERGIPRGGFSIAEWTSYRGFSPNGFYRMPPADRPDIIEVGGRKIITSEADRDWEAHMRAKARAKREGALPESSDGPAA